MLPLRFSVTLGVVLGGWRGERAGAQQPVWGCRAPFPPSPLGARGMFPDRAPCPMLRCSLPHWPLRGDWGSRDQQHTEPWAAPGAGLLIRGVTRCRYVLSWLPSVFSLGLQDLVVPGHPCVTAVSMSVKPQQSFGLIMAKSPSSCTIPGAWQICGLCPAPSPKKYLGDNVPSFPVPCCWVGVLLETGHRDLVFVSPPDTGSGLALCWSRAAGGSPCLVRKRQVIYCHFITGSE